MFERVSVMIIYCGIEHFYINHFPQSPSTKPLVLINQNQVIDFSPSLRSLGINLATPLKNIKQIYSKVKIEPINLANFSAALTSAGFSP